MAEPTMVEKHCPFCHRDLGPESFTPDPRFADGRAPRCRECSAGAFRADPAPAPPPEPVGENPWIVAKRLQWNTRQTHLPNRRRARKMVERALRAGRLERKPCELRLPGCEREPAEAHHESYEPGRELEVVWVCRSCHASAFTSDALGASNAGRRG